MTKSPDLCWQVLHDEDEWWEGADGEETGPGSGGKPTGAARKVTGWRLLSLLVAAGLLGAQLFWLFTSPAQMGTGQTAAPPVQPLYTWESDYFVITYAAAADRAAVVEVARLLDGRWGVLRRALALTATDGEPKIGVQAVEIVGQEQEGSPCAVLVAAGEGAVAQAIPLADGSGGWQVSPAFGLGLERWAAVQLCPLGPARQELGEDISALPALPRLAELRPGLYSYPYGGESPGATEREGAVFAAFLDYATQKYGVGRLPLLLAELQQPVTWDALIPAVFDVSAVEFEAGWREWLARE